MFDPKLMAGQRILVTGGGTGLGQAMAEQFLRLGADIAICGRRKAVCDATAEAWRQQFPERRIDTFGVDIRAADAVDDDGRGALAVGRPDRARQQRGRQLRRPHRKPLVARLRRHRQYRLPRLVLRHAGRRQALGRGSEGGRVDDGASRAATS